MEIKKEDLLQAFADLKKSKVETIQAEIRVEPGVYNGAKKVYDVLNENFVYGWKIHVSSLSLSNYINW